MARALGSLTELGGVDEIVLLSTCNRTEFYVIADRDGRERLHNWLLDDRNLDPSFGETIFSLDDDEAIRHIFRVACGLDSMVLGEPQILGQLKDAFRHAQTAETLGPQLGRLLQHTFAVAKKIRTDTEIGASPVSVASAAVNLANQFFAGFQKHTALLVGAGVTVELLARHLSRRDIGRLFVANRDVERARALASRFGGFALPLEELVQNALAARRDLGHVDRNVGGAVRGRLVRLSIGHNFPSWAMRWSVTPPGGASVLYAWR